MQRLALTAALALVAAPLSAAAQEAPSASQDSPVAALAACRAIADDAARLRCFDSAAAAFTAAVDRKEVVVVGREELRRAKRADFGLGRSRAIEEEVRVKEPEVREVTSVVRSVSESGYRLLRVRLEDGSVWQTIEPMIEEPKGGEPVRIRRGMIGNYMASFKGRIAVRVKRVD